MYPALHQQEQGSGDEVVPTSLGRWASPNPVAHRMAWMQPCLSPTLASPAASC